MLKPIPIPDPIKILKQIPIPDPVQIPKPIPDLLSGIDSKKVEAIQNRFRPKLHFSHL